MQTQTTYNTYLNGELVTSFHGKFYDVLVFSDRSAHAKYKVLISAHLKYDQFSYRDIGLAEQFKIGVRAIVKGFYEDGKKKYLQYHRDVNLMIQGKNLSKLYVQTPYGGFISIKDLLAVTKPLARQVVIRTK